MAKYGQVFYRRDGEMLPTTTVVEWEAGVQYVADLRQLCKRTVKALFGYPSNDLHLVEVPSDTKSYLPTTGGLVVDPGRRWEVIRDPDCGCLKWRLAGG